MINRVLIRIRVIQVLYSYYQNQDGNLKKSEAELNLSFQKSYDLYFYLLGLLIAITDAYAKRVEANKSKLLPSYEDMNPNVRLLDNKFIGQLRKNTELSEYLNKRPFDWNEQESFIKTILNRILVSEIYKDYIALENPSYEDDRDFWRKIFKKFIYANEDLDDLLEDESIFWNDDIEIIESFVLKTIKKLEEDDTNQQVLLPMFRDEEDSEFAVKLLRESLFNMKEYREMITHHAQNWESERIAFMDLVIMQAALTEIINFPSIPVNVTLNEYIDVAKVYSTEKSASFINGILDSIVNELRASKKLFK
ncbi:transcription antitermination factor NusB [Dysgonomonas sp. 216]|uniref:transcription antitermination factor NusB n=1 Tax=Dysgonomonas sp. 216 TaxID=2302934 RepID=UPI0013D6FAC2|nr:transcription antitermination factor NusB [Dysgonomonas sp. 216]NDW18907.1 transcription antitermination factor NusB [Dysgonomonas sp. 216]